MRMFLAKLAKQRNMPPHMGALINIYTSTAILYSPLTLMGVATTVYGLWGQETIRGWIPWFTLWHLLGVMVLFILVMMVVFHKFVLPSIYAFQVQQQYKHRNPLAKDTQDILKMMGRHDKELKDIKNILVEMKSGLGNEEQKETEKPSQEIELPWWD